MAVRPCQTCGAELGGRRSDARYCSAVCRSKAAKRRDRPSVPPEFQLADEGPERDKVEAGLANSLLRRALEGDVNAARYLLRCQFGWPA
jgi:hypothetical protein